MIDEGEIRSELLSPTGRVIMVSGASRGIGAAIARRLHDEGFSLSVGVRRPAEVLAKFAAFDADRLQVSRFDAQDSDTAETWLAETMSRFDRLDGLINNAGIIKPLSFAEGDESALDELWAVNVKAPFRLIRLALPHLAQSRNGRIISIASTDAKRYRDVTVSIAYAMTKHAVLALSHAAKFAGWENGVRVTALCPGAVDTDFTAGIPGVTPLANRLAPGTLAEIVALLLRLPNNASVAELVVNTRLEHSL
jgi:NAD(P)-dependent dehydrogenase (short-subunit alcohol dehydrogenase family)